MLAHDVSVGPVSHVIALIEGAHLNLELDKLPERKVARHEDVHVNVHVNGLRRTVDS